MNLESQADLRRVLMPSPPDAAPAGTKLRLPRGAYTPIDYSGLYLMHTSGLTVLLDPTPFNLHSGTLVLPTIAADRLAPAHPAEHVATMHSQIERAGPRLERYYSMNALAHTRGVGAATFDRGTHYSVSSPHLPTFLELLKGHLECVLFHQFSNLEFDMEICHVRLRRAREGGFTACFGGVVHSEVTHYRSDPLWQRFHLLGKTLFPDTHCRYDFGPPPYEVSRLRPHHLRKYLADNYKPSRALLILSQPGGFEQSLAVLDSLLQRQAPNGSYERPPIQALFLEPRSAHAEYPYFGRSLRQAPHWVEVAWGLRPPLPLQRYARLLLATEYLSDPHQSPVIRALQAAFPRAAVTTESDLDSLQPSFSFSLRGAPADQRGRIAELVLQHLASGGPSPLTTAALRRSVLADILEAHVTPGAIEDNHTTLAGRFLNGQNPRDMLGLPRAVRALTARDLQACLRDEFIGNPHRVDLSIAPRLDLAERLLNQERSAARRRAAKLGKTALLAAQLERRRFIRGRRKAALTDAWRLRQPPASLIEDDGPWPHAIGSSQRVFFTPAKIPGLSGVDLVFRADARVTPLLEFWPLLSKAMFSPGNPWLNDERRYARFRRFVHRPSIEEYADEEPTSDALFFKVNFFAFRGHEREAIELMSECVRQAPAPSAVAAYAEACFAELDAISLEDEAEFLAVAARARISRAHALLDRAGVHAQFDALRRLTTAPCNEQSAAAEGMRRLHECVFGGGADLIHLAADPRSEIVAHRLADAAEWRTPAGVWHKGYGELSTRSHYRRPSSSAGYAITFDLSAVPLARRAALYPFLLAWRYHRLQNEVRSARSVYHIKLRTNELGQFPAFVVGWAHPSSIERAREQELDHFFRLAAANPPATADILAARARALAEVSEEDYSPLGRASERFCDLVVGDSPEKRIERRRLIAEADPQTAFELIRELAAHPPRMASVTVLPEK